MSDKISCQIARDLMPLVIDEVCSEESRRAVEEHMAGCEDCAKMFVEMKAEVPAPARDEEADAHFRDSMKKTRRRTRWPKIIAAVLALVLVWGVLYAVQNMESFYTNDRFVPASWIGNPRLERTENGELLFRFTPDSRYKAYMGDSLQYQIPFHVDMEEGACYNLRYIGFRYSSLAAVLNTTPPVHLRRDREIFVLPDGDWVYPMRQQCTCRWEEGTVRYQTVRSLTEDEMAEYTQQGIGNITDMTVVDYCRNEDGSFVEGMKLAIVPDNLLVDEQGYALIPQTYDEQYVIVDSADGVPLCGRETAEAYERWKKETGSGEVRWIAD